MYLLFEARSYQSRSQVSFCNEISIIEQLTYKPHPADESKTVMTQETLIEVHGIPLSSYFEEFVYKDIAKNALKVSLVV